LNGSSSTIRKRTYPLKKSFTRFYLQGVVISFIEGELFHDKRRNLTLYEKLMLILLTGNRDVSY
jgi:hypothetical protein